MAHNNQGNFIARRKWNQSLRAVASAAFILMTSAVAAQFDTLSVGNRRYVQINEEQALGLIEAQNTTIQLLTTSGDSLVHSLVYAADSIGVLNGALATAADSIGVLNLAYQMLEDSLTSLFSVPGCTYATYLEYDPLATWEDGSCEVIAIPGCMDDAYLEYNAEANISDGGCLTIIVEGCLNYLYAEFEAAANVDDGSCATYLCNSVTFDGYAYDLVQINDQCWFAENLQTTVTSAGTPIPYVTNSTEWSAATGGAQNYAYNSEANLAAYGRLYNGYAATHSEGICPTGWHVSSLADWDSLTQYMTDEGYGNFLGMALRAGYDWETTEGALSTTTLGWDTFGFNALPAGAYTGSNWMYVSRSITSYWTSDKASNTRAAVKELVEWDTGITHYSSVSFGNGKSIRCVLDRP